MQSIKNPTNLAGLSQCWCLWLFDLCLHVGMNNAVKPMIAIIKCCLENDYVMYNHTLIY